MVSVYLIDWPDLEHLYAEATLDLALAEVRGHWHEDDGPQAFVFLGARREPLAWCVRDPQDAELCHTHYADGTTETHRCTYVYTESGEYQASRVVAVA